MPATLTLTTLVVLAALNALVWGAVLGLKAAEKSAKKFRK